jgi:WD40 repeat protein
VIQIWDASTVADILPRLQEHGFNVRSVAFAHHNSLFASGSNDMTIRVWGASTGMEDLPPLRGHDNWVRSVAFSHDNSKIVSGSDD